MKNLSHIHGKKLSVIFVEEDGTKLGNWTLLTGIGKWRDPHLFVHRGMDIPEFRIPDGTLDRVKPVPPEISELVGQADYYIMLTVGSISPHARADDESELEHEHEHTALKLPR